MAQMVAHVSFIKVEGKLKPFRAIFRCPPRQSTNSSRTLKVFELDLDNVQFSYEDVEYNKDVYKFLTTTDDSIITDTMVTIITNDMDQSIEDWYADYKKDSWDMTIGAVDKATARYLGRLLPYVLELPTMDLGLAYTDYAMREIEERDASWLKEN